MKIGRVMKRGSCFVVGALVVVMAGGSPALAGDDQDHGQHQDGQKNQAGDLISVPMSSGYSSSERRDHSMDLTIWPS